MAAKKLKIKRKSLFGFTLIELLVVIGVLSLLLSIVLIAINPLEQMNKATDIKAQSVISDLTKATGYYYTYKKTLPWEEDLACRAELSSGKTLSEVPSCLSALSESEGVGSKSAIQDVSNDIYITECSSSVAICYKPKSSELGKSPDAKYTQNGVLNPDCATNPTGSKGCYVCSFSTNNAQECFQAMNPNGSLAIVPNPSPSTPLPIVEKNSVSSCKDAPVGKASCMAQVVADSNDTPLSSIAPPAGFGPEQIHRAYGLPCTPGGVYSSLCTAPIVFGPKIIATVIAYHNPTLESDLAVYSNRYGLPACTKANGCLTVVNQYGQTSPLPGTDSSWALEESMDVQILHAVCQTCKILVVEANTNYFSDLGVAVNRAVLMGASAISNSYGANEWSGSTAYDSYYNHPGVFVTASSGDSGYGAAYPAASKNVIAVGGTTLSLLSDNSYNSESVWSGAGSGCSALQSVNSFQSSLSNWSSTGCGTKRAISDVSAVANPSTGAAVYDSTYAGYSAWWILGGTSLSSPIVAAALAMNATAPSGIDAGSYIYSNLSKFRDVTIGSNGSCGGSIICKAAVGYDGPTGVGSPNFLAVTSPVANSPTPSFTPTPSPTTASLGAYIVDVNNKTYTKVTRHTLTGQTPIVDCALGETTSCSQIPIISGSDAIGQCNVGNTGYAVFSKVSCSIISINPTPTPAPVISCGLAQTVTLNTTTPILALPGDTVNNTLSIKNNSSSECGMTLYTISRGSPSGWTVTGVPASINVAGGATTNIFFTIQVPLSATAGNYGYQFWVARPGETTPNPVNGSIQVAQAGPTNTPTPTPINCFSPWSNSLGSTSLSGNAGDTLNQTITIKNNNSPSCPGKGTFGISHSYPSGWIINGLPPSVQLAGGESITIPFTIKISTGAQTQDYLMQYWINSGSNPMNATVHVLGLATPPEEQMFSNFGGKSYGNYATFEFSYNAQGAVSSRLDVSTDPNGLNTISVPAPTGTRYGFAFTSGYAWESSNNPSPIAVRGFIVSNPQSWSGWQCGATIYYRMYNDGDKRIKSPVRSTVVDCNTQINVLPWDPWYQAIYQGVYDARYDADNNGVVNWTDYWILVRATRLR